MGGLSERGRKWARSVAEFDRIANASARPVIEATRQYYKIDRKILF